MKDGRIFIAGYFGFGNLGDEAILSAMLGEFRKLRPSLQATVTSGKPSETARSHGVETVPWRDPVAIEQAVRLADLVLIGGGGLFQDYWGFNPDTMLSESHAGLSFYAAPAVLAALHRKPLMLYAVGVGPLLSEVGRRFTKAVSETASAITVRDPASKRHLEFLGVPGSRIVLSADPAFALNAADESRTHDLIASLGLTGAPSPRVVVALRHWDIGVAPEFWERETAQGLDTFLGREGGSVLFVPFQRIAGRLENDVAVAERVRSRMKHRKSTFLLDKDCSPAEIAGLLSRFDLVLGMRLHAGILAVAGGVPLVALSYDPKVAQLMEQIGFPDFAIELGEIRAQRLTDTMRRALAQRDTYGQALRGARERMRGLAQENARLAVELLRPQTEEVSDPTAELPLLVAHAIRSQLRAIQDLQTDLPRLVAARNELLKIHGSRFWRFASVYWAVCRWVQQPFRDRGAEPAPAIGPVTARNETPPQESPDVRKGADPDSYQKQLAAVAARIGQSKGLVILLPSARWAIPLAQRPHHLARAFAQEGYTAVFHTPDTHDDVDGFKEIEPNLFLFHGPEGLLWQLPEPLLWTLAYNFDQKDAYPRSAQVVYDWIDDLEIFPHQRRALLEQNHARGLEEATLVACVAQRLHQRALQRRPDALYLPNGVDFDRFANDSAPLPEDLAGLLESKKPIAGYYGALAEWFDYELLDSVAQHRQDWNFLLIGPMYDQSLLSQPILTRSNVTWLGPREYHTLPGYLGAFDVATIPFRINDITLATSPLKLYEYFAAGKPVITTPMPECQAFSEVHIVRTLEDFSAALDRAKQEGRDPRFRERLRLLARANSWTERVRLVLEQLARASSHAVPATR